MGDEMDPSSTRRRDAAGLGATRIVGVSCGLQGGWSDMANSFGADIIIQTPEPEVAAAFYVDHLGFEVTAEVPMISLRGDNINLFIERGPEHGPVLEVTVDDVDAAKLDLLRSGCELVKDEPEVPRCYVKDPFGVTYNLTT